MDLEDMAIERLVDRYRNSATLDVDVYEVGHHGSHNGTTEELLDAMTPKIAAISVGHWDDGKLKKATKKRKAKPFTTHADGWATDTFRDKLREFATSLRGVRGCKPTASSHLPRPSGYGTRDA